MNKTELLSAETELVENQQEAEKHFESPDLTEPEIESLDRRENAALLVKYFSAWQEKGGESNKAAVIGLIHTGQIIGQLPKSELTDDQLVDVASDWFDPDRREPRYSSSAEQDESHEQFMAEVDIYYLGQIFSGQLEMDDADQQARIYYLEKTGTDPDLDGETIMLNDQMPTEPSGSLESSGPTASGHAAKIKEISAAVSASVASSHEKNKPNQKLGEVKLQK